MKVILPLFAIASVSALSIQRRMEAAPPGGLVIASPPGGLPIEDCKVVEESKEDNEAGAAPPKSLFPPWVPRDCSLPPSINESRQPGTMTLAEKAAAAAAKIVEKYRLLRQERLEKDLAASVAEQESSKNADNEWEQVADDYAKEIERERLAYNREVELKAKADLRKSAWDLRKEERKRKQIAEQLALEEKEKAEAEKKKAEAEKKKVEAEKQAEQDLLAQQGKEGEIRPATPSTNPNSPIASTPIAAPAIKPSTTAATTSKSPLQIHAPEFKPVSPAPVSADKQAPKPSLSATPAAFVPIKGGELPPVVPDQPISSPSPQKPISKPVSPPTVFPNHLWRVFMKSEEGFANPRFTKPFVLTEFEYEGPSDPVQLRDDAPVLLAKPIHFKDMGDLETNIRFCFSELGKLTIAGQIGIIDIAERDVQQTKWIRCVAATNPRPFDYEQDKYVRKSYSYRVANSVPVYVHSKRIGSESPHLALLQ